MSFKKGDKVRLTGTEWENMGGGKDWTGKTVKIRKVYEDEDAGVFSKGGEEFWYVYDEDVDDPDLFMEWGGELVETTGSLDTTFSVDPKPKFKVGDVVRVKNVNTQARPDDAVFTVNKIVTDRAISLEYRPRKNNPEWYQIYYIGDDTPGDERYAIWEENLVLDKDSLEKVANNMSEILDEIAAEISSTLKKLGADLAEIVERAGINA